MYEIKLTLDATSALIGALQGLAGAIRDAAHPVAPLPPSNLCGPLTPRDRPAGLREGIEKDDAAEKAQNLPSEAHVVAVRPEATENVVEPKKRKPRAKKAPSEINNPVSPAIGDSSSPVGDSSSPAGACAEPGPSAPEETPAEPEPASGVADPAPVEGAVSFACASYIGARVSETPAPEPSPVEEAPSAMAEDPLAGKGRTGEILAELTRKAIGDLDALGVDRGDANRRIRAYCDYHGIKFATFPALLHAVGYADAIEICKGNLK